MLALLLSCIIVFAVQVNANNYTNPIALKAPDPWMEYYKGYYYLVATTWGNTVGIRKSKTLNGLKSVPNQVVYTLDGHTLWAPEIHLVNQKWYLYYTSCKPNTKDPLCHRNRVAESISDDPMGPYHFKVSYPHIRVKHLHNICSCSIKADLVDPKDENFELDPSLIKINGSLYLLGSYVKGTQKLYIQHLSNPYTIAGPKHELSAATLPWELQGLHVNEGPEPLYHKGKTFVVYSASYCDTPDYKLGLLEFVGTDPLNNTHWHKHPTPVFQRNDRAHVYGPGHNGFFKSPDGREDWIVYHANDSPSGHCDMNRSSRAQKFTWGADGLPVFGLPDANGVVLQSPSGETNH